MIDGIVPEPLGGAHRDKAVTITAVGDALEAALAELRDSDGDAIRGGRWDKFLAMGQKGLA